MSLRIGLVGLPNAGKSTLFNALTQQQALVADYPFATIEPNLGTVAIPDKRLSVLAKIFASQKIVSAEITFIDIAGLIAGAHKGEGLGNKFLDHIRQTDMIVYVGSVFNNKQTPEHDLDTILTELILADWQTVSKQIPKLEKVVKGDASQQPLLDTTKQALDNLDQAIYLNQAPQADHFKAVLRHLNLLTLKPLLLVFNLKSSDLNNQDLQVKLAKIKPQFSRLLLSAELETELNHLSSSDQVTFLKAYNLTESGLVNLTKTSFKILNLQTFLTAGDTEVRAWTIQTGTLAPQAAGVIHSDIERGFIAAEIINYSDLVTAQSWTQAKANGLCRIEGRHYVMRVDDVVNFKFNV